MYADNKVAYWWASLYSIVKGHARMSVVPTQYCYLDGWYTQFGHMCYLLCPDRSETACLPLCGYVRRRRQLWPLRKIGTGYQTVFNPACLCIGLHVLECSYQVYIKPAGLEGEHDPPAPPTSPEARRRQVWSEVRSHTHAHMHTSMRTHTHS